MYDIAAAGARLLTRIAAVFLLAMMMLNVIDVGLKTGLNAPIFGTYEIIELFLAAAAFLAIPEVFLRDQHITIELIDQVVPPRVVRWLRLWGALVAAVFVGLLAYHMIQPAMESVEFNDVTIDLQIPLIWKGSLVLAGFGFSVVAAIIMFVREITHPGGQVNGRAGEHAE